MRITAAGPKRAQPRDTWPFALRPGHRRERDVKTKSLKAQIRVLCLRMDIWCNLSVPELQQEFCEPCNPGRAFAMADIRFDRA